MERESERVIEREPMLYTLNWGEEKKKRTKPDRTNEHTEKKLTEKTSKKRNLLKFLFKKKCTLSARAKRNLWWTRTVLKKKKKLNNESLFYALEAKTQRK